MTSVNNVFTLENPASNYSPNSSLQHLKTTQLGKYMCI